MVHLLHRLYGVDAPAHGSVDTWSAVRLSGVFSVRFVFATSRICIYASSAL